MNATEYKAYTEAVNRFTYENKVSPGMWSPKVSGMAPHFSHIACDCCRRDQSGNREDYVFIGEGGKFEAAICTDCVYFLEYGQLDDMTMLEVGASRERKTPLQNN